MALMPDVTMLLFDPDLGAQTFEVKRRKGEWIGGRLVMRQQETITATGIIQPPSPEQLAMFPEGERRQGMIAIYTTTILHLSDGKDVSDDVTWRGEQYKVIHIDRWTDYGYCVAYAQKR